MYFRFERFVKLNNAYSLRGLEVGRLQARDLFLCDKSTTRWRTAAVTVYDAAAVISAEPVRTPATTALQRV